MHRIVVIMHEKDRSLRNGAQKSTYLVSALAPHWRRMGHSVRVAFGIDNLPEADLAILHVDLSVTPEIYLRAAARYPVVVNGDARDIRKRLVSRNVLGSGDHWPGPVIVKSDLNNGGIPERLRATGRCGDSADVRRVHASGFNRYQVWNSLAQVPAAVFTNRRLVVERFLPERHGEFSAIRSWGFLGDRERCRRFLKADPIVKGQGLVPDELVEVPAAIRAERKRLGFDYGKFDFVLHDGEPVLLDANRTPGAPPRFVDAEFDAVLADLAGGLESIVAARRAR